MVERRFPGTAQEARGAYVRLLYTPGCGRKKKRETRKKREEGPSATEALIFLDESPPEIRLAQKGGLSGVFFLVLVFGFFFRLCVLSFFRLLFYWNFFSTFVSFTLFFRAESCVFADKDAAFELGSSSCTQADGEKRPDERARSEPKGGLRLLFDGCTFGVPRFPQYTVNKVSLWFRPASSLASL